MHYDYIQTVLSVFLAIYLNEVKIMFSNVSPEISWSVFWAGWVICGIINTSQSAGTYQHNSPNTSDINLQQKNEIYLLSGTLILSFVLGPIGLGMNSARIENATIHRK